MIIVLVIVSIGGFFSASEMALVSLRETQVRSLGRRGKRGQKAARLASDPNRFLSAVQIGVTLATLVSGAFGADTLVGLLHSWLVRHGVSGDGGVPARVRHRHRVHYLRQPGTRRAGAQADRAAAVDVARAVRGPAA